MQKYIVMCEEHYNPLGVVRSLGVTGIKPIAIIKKGKYGITSKSKYLSKVYFVDSNEEALNLLINKFGYEDTKPFVLTCDDQMASLLDLNYNNLKNKFIFFNAGEQGRITKYMNKSKIMKLANDCGLKTAKSWNIRGKEIPDDISYPVLTKAIISTKDNWKADSIICNNRDELEIALNKICSEDILVQEYIKKKNELCYDGFSCDRGKKVLYSISTYYLYVKEGAYSYYMEVSYSQNRELEEKLNNMFKKIMYEGIFSVEFLVDEYDNYYFLEINFRNSTWSWASTVAGMNLPILWSKCMVNSNIFSNCYIKFKPFKAMVENAYFNDMVRTKKISKFKWVCDFISSKVKFLWYYRDIKPVLSKYIRKIKKDFY